MKGMGLGGGAACALLASLAMAGCGSTASSAPEATCQYIFDASATSGPHAGTHITGIFRPLVQGGGSIHGSMSAYVVTSSGSGRQMHDLDVLGLENDRTVDFFVTLPDGSKVDINGTEESTITQCSGTMSGKVKGATGLDEGDWVAGVLPTTPSGS